MCASHAICEMTDGGMTALPAAAMSGIAYGGFFLSDAMKDKAITNLVEIVKQTACAGSKYFYCLYVMLLDVHLCINCVSNCISVTDWEKSFESSAQDETKVENPDFAPVVEWWAQCAMRSFAQIVRLPMFTADHPRIKPAMAEKRLVDSWIPSMVQVRLSIC